MRTFEKYWNDKRENALNDVYQSFVDLVGYYLSDEVSEAQAITNAWMDVEATCDRACRDLENKIGD